jgi:hypothetical protein
MGVCKMIAAFITLECWSKLEMLTFYGRIKAREPFSVYGFMGSKKLYYVRRNKVNTELVEHELTNGHPLEKRVDE